MCILIAKYVRNNYGLLFALWTGSCAVEAQQLQACTVHRARTVLRRSGVLHHLPCLHIEHLPLAGVRSFGPIKDGG